MPTAVGEGEGDEEPQTKAGSQGVTQRRGLKMFIAGASGGAVSRTATAPLDRMRMLLQVSSGKRMGLSEAARSMASEGGIKPFFRGNGANVAKIAPENAAKLFLYDLYKSNVLSGKCAHPFQHLSGKGQDPPECLLGYAAIAVANRAKVIGMRQVARTNRPAPQADWRGGLRRASANLRVPAGDCEDALGSFQSGDVQRDSSLPAQHSKERGGEEAVCRGGALSGGDTALRWGGHDGV